MILGLGVDIVSTDRIAQMLERRGGRALARLYTDIEREYCDRMPKPALHYAARFAAKEAFVKALGVGFSEGIRWRDIGVVNDDKGKPEIHAEGSAKEHMDAVGADRAHLSLSHDPTNALAVVVLEKTQ